MIEKEKIRKAMEKWFGKGNVGVSLEQRDVNFARYMIEIQNAPQYATKQKRRLTGKGCHA